MRYAVAVIAAAFLSTATAQSNWIYPSPFGVIVSAGKLIYDSDYKREHLVTVKSIGNDERDARAHGFQLAIEHVVGQLILSESAINNKEVVRKEIIQYSSGYVSKYEVRELTKSGDQTIVVMDVWVKESKIADRLTANIQQNNKVDGRNVAARIITVQRQTDNGDRVLRAVLNDYPTKAMNVSYKDVYVERTSDRNVNMVIPVTVGWNEGYLKGVGEALVAINEGVSYKNRRNGYRLVSRLPGIIYSRTYDVWTEDIKRYSLFNDTFATIGIRVEIFNGGGNRIYEKCDTPQHELAKFIDNQVILDGRAKLNHTMVVEIQSEEFVENMDRIVITAVKYCKQPMMAGR